MFDKNIVSEKYRDFNLILEEKKNDYLNANPFPSIILDDFFNDTFLNKVLEEFPDLSKEDSSQNYKNKNEVKYTNNVYKNFPDTIKQLFDFMNSNFFLEFLQKITSIEEKLISDKDLNGGGLHEIKTGGKLKVHTDFSRHPTLDLDRRINILIYLNKNWDKNYGGDLEFWNQDMSLCKKKISPNFNKLVIFSTNDFSNHGHPDPINCPDNLSRKSIALYYFSKGRPISDLNNKNFKNKTYFKSRDGFVNETYNQNEKIKNYLRKFKFYKYLKELEKKYLRKNK
jgi:Rps23 Pro-64 3,4-dihydroxylase Tpa1-like proline 4-hydroxylase